MYEHLKSRSRLIVLQLLAGRQLTIGGQTAGPMSDGQKRALSLLATDLDQLEQKTGAGLAEAIVQQLKDYPLPKVPEELLTVASDPAAVPWRLGRLRASSFRGLAPAEQIWEHDFEGHSLLLYGPNGCGKSSLLGAIAWCLTGLVLRDDCPPTTSEDVAVYDAEDSPGTAGTRPDAMSLTDGDGHSTDSDGEYWVELEFITDKGAEDGARLWLRRHCAAGLATSVDGADWTSINCLGDAGIAELDAELRIAMPARVPHIRFGKDRNLLSLFSQMVGMDDLERIAALAAKARQAINTQLGKLQRLTIPAQEKLVSGATAAIEEVATEAIRELPTYRAALAGLRTLEGIAAFGKTVSESLAKASAQLAADLGVAIPSSDTPEYKAACDQLRLLPGQVSNAVNHLSKQLQDSMPKSAGLMVSSAEEAAKLAQDLEEFESGARVKAQERLKWSVEESKDEKASLMLDAASHFPEGSAECPVCTQNLEPVPAVRVRLTELRPLAQLPHLRQNIDDLERALLARLGELVTPALREQGKQALADRLLSDWSALKKLHFPGFLAGVADRFDLHISLLSEQVRAIPPMPQPRTSEGYEKDFREAFIALNAALREAWKYVHLARSVIEHGEKLVQELTRLLKPPADGGMADSLSALLARGSATNDEIGALTQVQKSARALWTAQKDLDALRKSEQAYESAATAFEPVKRLAPMVQQEVMEVVGTIEPKMKELYAALYHDELLVLDMVTPGHPANPTKRDEINAYFLAGEQRVPVAPFSNSGRFRALVLSFVFAMLDRSRGTLGILLLDDPALSLDDDHMARLVDYLIAPRLEKDQVLLATHYETFYKAAEPALPTAQHLQLHPRPRAADAVGFEPGDLLQRVKESLAEAKASWRETGIDLRRWAERTLRTLSGFCPKPFFVFNNMPDTIASYEQITDPRVATTWRKEILAGLKSPQFERVINRIAHDEDPKKAEVFDAHACLVKCQKAVRHEIDSFRALHCHSLLGRAIPGPTINTISIKSMFKAAEVPVVAQAAAARDGMAISFQESSLAHIAEGPVALVKLDTLQPIARVGQYILLDPEERDPCDGDLVIAETESGDRYTRRFWRKGDAIHLEAQNATPPNYAPVVLNCGTCWMRRIIGVAFEPCRDINPGAVAAEWVPPNGYSIDLLSDAVGVRVKGTSLEPIAWDDQFALVRKCGNIAVVKPNTLACVDIAEEGAVIKRCYPGTDEWLLCSVNVNEPQEPMRVKPSSILNVYPLIGVLFEAVAEDQT